MPLYTHITHTYDSFVISFSYIVILLVHSVCSFSTAIVLHKYIFLNFLVVQLLLAFPVISVFCHFLHKNTCKSIGKTNNHYMPAFKQALCILSSVSKQKSKLPLIGFLTFDEVHHKIILFIFVFRNMNVSLCCYADNTNSLFICSRKVKISHIKFLYAVQYNHFFFFIVLLQLVSPSCSTLLVGFVLVL